MTMPMKPSLLVVCALLALTGCVDRGKQQQAKATEKIVTDPTTSVTVEPARQEDVPDYLTLTGQIVTSENVTVGAKNPGRIVAVYVRDGDAVSAGQAIAQQETTEAAARLRQAQAGVQSSKSQLDQALIDLKTAPTRSTAAVRGSEARLAQARQALAKLLNGAREEDRKSAQIAVDRTKSDLDLAKKELDRQRNLYKEGAVALTDVEQAENKRDNAMAAYQQALEQVKITNDQSRPEDVAAAREALRQAEAQLKSDQAAKETDPIYRQRVDAASANLQSAQDALTLARQALSDMTIKSPVSGRVSGRPLQAGSYAGPGTAVATVIGSGGAYFDAEIPEKEVSRIHEGQEVDVKVTAADSQTHRAVVRTVSPAASSVGRLFSARVEFDSRDTTVKPGMFASGQLLLGTDAGVITVPTAAVLTDGGDARVFLVVGDKAKRASVKVVRSYGLRSIVTGLSPGDKVVTKGQSTLVDGAPVKVVTGEPAPAEAGA